MTGRQQSEPIHKMSYARVIAIASSAALAPSLGYHYHQHRTISNLTQDTMDMTQRNTLLIEDIDNRQKEVEKQQKELKKLRDDAEYISRLHIVSGTIASIQLAIKVITFFY